jgi:hypothetical protein
MTIDKTFHGYICSAVKNVTGKDQRLKLVVPISTYARIQSNCGKEPFGKEVVQRLFDAWIRQREESGALDVLTDGALLEGEVDGLFSDIRAADRRKKGGWTKSVAKS